MPLKMGHGPIGLDLVLIKYINAIKGEWKRGIRRETHPSADGRVRKVTVSYKSLSTESGGSQYRGSKFVDVQRPVHNVVVLLLMNKLS